MKLEIKLLGFLRKYSLNENDSFSLELPDGSKIQDVINKLQIPEGEPRIIILNGRHAKEDAMIKNGDEVVLMTPIEGG